MKFEIKNRFDGDVIFSIETESFKLAVEAAVKAKTNLRGCDLRYSNLSGCDLRGCDLSGSNLSGCDLSGSDLSGCDLRGCDLRYSNLSGCDLRGSNLSGCNLRCCDLSYSNLSGSDLRGCDLRYSNLSGCDLRGSNLSGCNLRCCDLSGSDLSGVKNLPLTMRIETGETWKEYLEETVPALLAAGGHPVTKKSWTCHSWDNCPMAEAFGVHQIEDIPILYRPRAQQFIRYFDAKLIPAPETLVD